MTISLRTNVSSLNAQKNLMKNERSLTQAMGRLSSGLRINQAADDSAGLAISEKLRAHTRGLNQAMRNANDGISLIQTAEGALNEDSDMLIRIRELAVQASSGTLGTAERAAIHSEFTALKAEIDRIAAVTEFNGQKLVNGGLSSGMTFQVGIMNSGNDRITLSVSSAVSSALGLTSGMTLSTSTGAQASLGLIDTAISAVASRRGELGSMQNRLYSTINNLSASHENLSAANSRIRDADIAKESATFTASQILLQSGVSILAQANQLPSVATQLIG